MGLEAAELARWTRFAAKGGIGKCTALCDCVAESQDDLMFLKDDEITVLFQIPEVEGTYLGYCEGVVGRFNGAHVRFLTRLKKPIMTKRASVSASSVGGKSPTPTPTSTSAATGGLGGTGGGGKSPSPAFGVGQQGQGQGQTRRSSQTRKDTHSLERRSSTSASTQTRVMSPLSMSVSVGGAGDDGSDTRVYRGSSAGGGGVPQRHEQQRHTSFSSNAATSTSTTNSETRVDSPSNFGIEPPRSMSASMSNPTSNLSSATSTTTTTVSTTSSGYDTPSPRNANFTISTELPPPTVSISHPTSSGDTHRNSTHPHPTTSSTSAPTSYSTTNSPPPTQNQTPSQNQNQNQRYTAHPPAPLLLPNSLSVEPSSISPLRIMKRSPTSPPPASPYNLPPMQGSMSPGHSFPSLHPGMGIPPTPTSSASSASVYSNSTSVSRYSQPQPQPQPPLSADFPDSSYTAYDERQKEVFKRMDEEDEEQGLGLGQESEEVGIGLSLLRGLEGGFGGDSDSESDSGGSAYGDDTVGFSGARVDAGRGRGREDEEEKAYAEALDRVGRGGDEDGDSVYESQEGTAEGLGYARSEDSHAHMRGVVREDEEEGQEGAVSLPKDTLGTAPARSIANANANANADVNAPATSPTSPSFAHQSPNMDPRRPSLAPSTSAMSVSGVSISGKSISGKSISGASISGASTGSWEGASDIYDDYRYSRYSMASKMSRVSVLGYGGAGGEGEEEREMPPPVPDARMRSDSIQREQGKGVHLDLEEKKEEEGIKEEEEEREEEERQPRKRSTLVRTRDSVDSDVSVYTQNSRLSTLSQDAVALMALRGEESPPGTAVPGGGVVGGTAGTAGGGGHGRPAPLTLNKDAPLLSTTWGSPLSSPDYMASPKGSSTFYAPVPGAVRGGRAVGGMGMGMAGYAAEYESEVGAGGGPRSPTFLTSPTLGGFASQMRMRLEEERRSPNPEREVFDEQQEEQEKEQQEQDKSGLGHRIVVEDEDELPSRILNSTLNDSLGSSPSPSPEPELLVGKHLAPLVVANRTPSPSILEGGSDEGGGLAGRLRSLEDDEDVRHRQTQSPIVVPSTPPQGADVTLSPSPSPSHLRPSLRELREGGTVPVPGTNQRRSLFLPHPNAPKAPVGAETAGPMYIAAQQPQPQSQHQLQPQAAGQAPPQQQQYLQPGQQRLQQPPPQPQWNGPPPRPHLFAVIRMALSLPPRGAPIPPNVPPRPTMPMRGPTIYGRTEVDLGAAMGPVPIVFSVEPPLASAPQGAGAGAGVQGQGQMPPPRVQMMAKTQALRSKSVGPGVNAPPPPGAGAGPRMGGLTPPGAVVANEQKPPGGGVIPRANFFPKAAGLRPRSRSFSGFNSTTAEVPVPIQRSREDSEVLSAKDIKCSLTKTSSLSVPSPSPSLTTSRSLSSLSSPAPSPSPSSSSPLSSSSLSPSPSQSSSNPPPSKLSLTSSPLRPSPLSLSSVKPSSPSPSSPSSSAHGPLSPGLKPPSSPLAQSMTFAGAGAGSSASVPASPTQPSSPSFGSMGQSQRQHPLRQHSTPAGAGARTTLPASLSSSSSLSASASSSTTIAGSTTSTSTIISPPFASTPGRTASLQAVPSSSSAARRDRDRDTSPHSHLNPKNEKSDNDAQSILSSRSTLVSPPPPPVITRQTSLRSKLSLPNLRRKQSKQDVDSSSSAQGGQGPNNNGNGNGNGGNSYNANANDDMQMQMLQVQDMEFELVRPSLSHFQREAARTSEDSGVFGRESSFDGSSNPPGSLGSGGNTGGNGGGGGFLRAESPAMSVTSGRASSAGRSPVVEQGGAGGHASWIPAAGGGTAEMDAHRQRELKWMSLISSTSSSSSSSPSIPSSITDSSNSNSNANASSNNSSANAALRKSKKVRKMILEGVPSSVRYLVWSFLTDGKGRCVPGVYAQLGARGWGRVQGVQGQGAREKEKERVREDMERDVRDVLQEGEGDGGKGREKEVVGLLQAYLNMVPDVVYSKGLTQIVSHLLLLSPEEDAFWIFVSMMDAHLRPYFASSTSQMEVDATLMCRALEVNDGVLAKKLFGDMGVKGVDVCGVWFSSLFVGTLPQEYLNRVWDIFLFEGIPFLIRTALALLTCCRRFLLSPSSPAPTPAQILATLAHPPQAWLPASPDGFLALAFGIKMKDDDVRKQRVKMEAAVKRQTQREVRGGILGLGIGLGGSGGEKKPRVASVGGVGMISLPRT